MTRPGSEERVIRRFTSAEWDTQQGPGSIDFLAKLRARWVLLGFMVFGILTNLGAFGATVIVVGAIMLFLYANKSSPRKAFVKGLLADVNETIIELTGDANAGLGVKDFRALAEKSRPLPLPVNGVHGLNLQVVNEGPAQNRVAAVVRVDDTLRTTRVVVTATPPDYATASFDRLLQATLDTEPDNPPKTI